MHAAVVTALLPVSSRAVRSPSWGERSTTRGHRPGSRCQRGCWPQLGVHWPTRWAVRVGTGGTAGAGRRASPPPDAPKAPGRPRWRGRRAGIRGINVGGTPVGRYGSREGW